MKKFIEAYFANESRESVRIKLLEMLHTIIWDHAFIAQDDMLETCIPFFQTLHTLNQQSVAIKYAYLHSSLSYLFCSAISLIVDSVRELRLNERRFDALVEILNKIVQYSPNQDVRIMAVSGMIELFKVKFRTLPCTYVTKQYDAA